MFTIGVYEDKLALLSSNPYPNKFNFHTLKPKDAFHIFFKLFLWMCSYVSNWSMSAAGNFFFYIDQWIHQLHTQKGKTKHGPWGGREGWGWGVGLMNSTEKDYHSEEQMKDFYSV